MKYYLAIDIGASSGRGIIGSLNADGSLNLDEVYRFKNQNTLLDNHLTWDIDHLFKEVKNTIKEALKKYPLIESMSIDTWGVDYCLLDKDDKEIYPVYAYRDDRTKASIPEVHKIISFDKLYSITGTMFCEFNTIYQLYKDKMDGRLDKAVDFLMIPEYLMFKLTGVKAHEYTEASTTGIVNAKEKEYSKEIIDALGFNPSLFKKLNKPGEVLGDLRKEVQEEVNGNIKVMLCATHDTGSAVEGITMEKNSPYISSGTWSLLGIKSEKPYTTKIALDSNYSNEAGPNYIRVQKNIMGLWVTQCLAKELNVDFVTMSDMAEASTYDKIFDINDNRFLAPKDMKKEILSWFNDNNIEAPKTDGDLFNTTYRSLAESYRIALKELENITGKKFESLYVVGGGAKNKYLSKVTQEALDVKVVFLPIEATSYGNLLVQIKGDK